MYSIIFQNPDGNPGWRTKEWVDSKTIQSLLPLLRERKLLVLGVTFKFAESKDVAIRLTPTLKNSVLFLEETFREQKEKKQ